MNCEEIQEELSDYIDRRLGPKRRALVEGHLASCAVCRAEAEALSEAVGFTRDLPSLTPPPDFSRKVMARIRREAEKPARWERLFFPLQIKIPIHVTALLLIGVLAVYLYQPLPTGRRETAAPPPARSLAEKDVSSQAPSSPLPGLKKEETGKADKLVPGVSSGAPPKPDGDAAKPRKPERSLDLRASESKKEAPEAGAGISVEAGTRGAGSADPFAQSEKKAQTFDFRIIFAPTAPLKAGGARRRIDDLLKKSGGDYLPSEERPIAEKQNRSPESGALRLNIPPNQYGRFKAGLASFGKIVSESSGAPTSEAPSPLRVEIIILPSPPQ